MHTSPKTAPLVNHSLVGQTESSSDKVLTSASVDLQTSDPIDLHVAATPPPDMAPSRITSARAGASRKRILQGVPRRAPTSPIDIVRRILGSVGWGTRLAFVDGQFECFNGKHWAPVSETEMRRRILEVLEADDVASPTPKLISDVLQLLKTKTAVSLELHRPDVPKPIINCANGELWILPDGTVSLRPHDPESQHHYCLDVVYDPAATCPLYDRAIEEIFSRSSDRCAVGRYWDECVGTIINPVRKEPRIFVCRGAGGDGKTRLVRLALRLLHPIVIAAMPVEELTGSRFVRGDLIWKRLFVDMDMTAGVTLPDGMLKLMSEGELATAERKNRDSITFTLRAVPLLVGNNVPRLLDRSQGFKRRLCVVPFDRSFTPEEQDPLLFQRIAETEMPGVLNRALAGLQRVIRRGWKIHLPEDVRSATEAWWAEATGQGFAEPRGPNAPSKVDRSSADDVAGSSTEGLNLSLVPECVATAAPVADHSEVKVKSDLGPGKQEDEVAIEVVIAGASVTVRVRDQR